MITCELMGGIGNLMFQIAFLEYVGYKNNLQTFYYNRDNYLKFLNDDNLHNPNLKHSYDYLRIFKNFDWKVNVRNPFVYLNKINVPFYYNDIKITDNTHYVGFFQSEKYFNDINFIWNLFEPSDDITNSLNKYNKYLEGIICSIHIRRGDYLKYSDIHPPQDLVYFNNAMKEIGEVDKYLIFSDDIKWCKENFIGDKFVFIQNEKDYIELFLQSKCTHNIISNSSFSWWGAYLNKNENKKVIGPIKWFGNNIDHSRYNDKDIIPESWIKI